MSHGFAPGKQTPSSPPLSPLDSMVEGLVNDLSRTAKTELELLEARVALARYGVKWASAWGFVAACALLVALLAVAFGAILALIPHVGPLFATLIVVGLLLAIAAFAGWRAKEGVDDVRIALKRDLSQEGEPD
ncbi:phage holin family protein [Sphingopyxis sp. MWB1]|uniref:phage holin family protein n=1 Tax=Sphingopyxis sp. MWB1 TaxID=1537715 RepID=UPI001F3D0C9B|nr:phage holin family protein [Sphingopyxis sp. MWB1]